MYMEGKDDASISALGEWEDGGDMERCGESIWQGEHRFERKDDESSPLWDILSLRC